MKNTLTPEQIKNWRKIIFMQLQEKCGSGIYALIMPESEVIAYWQKMKSILEKPQQTKAQYLEKHIKKMCDHSNSITGQNGTYCLDCEKYV